MAPRMPGPLLIAGAGIGGLTLAIACARLGITTRLLEAREAVSEAGAGIQLGPNASRILLELGVPVMSIGRAARPERIMARSGASGRVLGNLPLGDRINERLGSPYLVLHRADLQAALLARAQEFSGIEILMGWQVSGVEPATSSIVAVSGAGAKVEGTALIGADGIWSRIRQVIAPGAVSTSIGKTAARALVKAGVAPRPMQANVIGTWFSPLGHVVHYPVRSGEEIAVVVIRNRALSGPGWGHEADSREVAADLLQIAPALGANWAASLNWRQWSLMEANPLGRWSHGRVALLGDAAHPILPFLAQGGAMAIEDAAVLAAALADYRGKPAEAFGKFERQRFERIRRVQLQSRRNGQIYQMSGAAAAMRDLAMQIVPGQRLIDGYDWLYGWKGGTRSDGLPTWSETPSDQGKV